MNGPTIRARMGLSSKAYNGGASPFKVSCHLTGNYQKSFQPKCSWSLNRLAEHLKHETISRPAS